MTIEAINSETMKFSVVGEGMSQDGKSNPMSINGTSKWIGPTCTEGANKK